jgi:hypothetical protein
LGTAGAFGGVCSQRYLRARGKTSRASPPHAPRGGRRRGRHAEVMKKGRRMSLFRASHSF